MPSGDSAGAADDASGTMRAQARCGNCFRQEPQDGGAVLFFLLPFCGKEKAGREGVLSVSPESDPDGKEGSGNGMYPPTFRPPVGQKRVFFFPEKKL